MDSLRSIIAIAASGLRAQSTRLRVVSENIANSNSTADGPNGLPYQRKVVSFGTLAQSENDPALVGVTGISLDNSAFKQKYDPAHPAADANGFVAMPNVQPIIEMSNMREASRSYEANLNMLESAQKMRDQLIDLLK